MLCLTDSSSYIYTRVKHFGMANIKFAASQAKTTNLYKNTRSKLLKCCANIYFNKQWLGKKKVIIKYANLKFTNNSPVSKGPNTLKKHNKILLFDWYVIVYLYTLLNTSGWQTFNQFCESDWGFILSKICPKNLQVRNESLIRKKFTSGKVPCEVSVVVKYRASVKQCGAQTVWCSKSKSTLHLGNNQNRKKSYLL